MLEYIELNNFKAFKRMSRLELKPITVLAGANSSGKSSIIHALLLLKQSLESQRNRHLALNGEFLNFSRCSEIVFGMQEDELVTFDLGLASSALPSELTEGRLSKFFSSAEVDTILREEQHDRIRASYTFTFGLHEQHSRDQIILHSTEMRSVLAGLQRRRAELILERIDNAYAGKVSIPSPAGLEPPSRVSNVEWARFLPERCTYRSESAYLLETSGPGGQRREVPLDLFAVPSLREGLSERLHYMGPLRSEPQRAYIMMGDRMELDHRGRHTAQFLQTEQGDTVDYLVNGHEKRISLLEAVNRTLGVMGLPQSVEPIAQAGIVSQLKLPLIGDGSQTVTIADVGFGVSQLLPVIVAGLWARKGDLIIFEQPESHLHPRVQFALADFFVLLTELGKQVIVETHSDHLINGLRRKIAGDLDDDLELASKVQVVFVRPPKDKGIGASIERLQFDEYGLVANWPPEFLPQSMIEAQDLLRAAAEKRRRSRASPRP